MQNCTSADNEKAITFEQLPANSQEFIKKHFSGIKVSYIKMETGFFDKSYDVIFVDGSEIEFDKKGEWSDVDCKFTHVPEEIIPQQIREYIAEHYKGQKVKEIDRDKKDYEVKLSNDLELTFDLKYNIIDID